MMNLYGMLGLLIFLAGGALLYHLGSGRVPSVMKPVADVWVRAGCDPKWINVGLWALFGLLAGAMLIFIGFPLYDALTDLGLGFQ